MSDPAPPLERIIQSNIRPKDADQALIELLASRFTYLTRSQWLSAIETGSLTLNGTTPVPELRLRAGDLLRWDATEIEEPPAHLHYETIHQSHDLLVVNKPANLPVHPAGPYFNHTLWALLRRQTGLEQLHIVTRLDRETSGLVLIALTPSAATHFHHQLAQHALHKRYLALLEGTGIRPQSVTGYLHRGKTISGALHMELTAAPSQGAKQARTQITPIRCNPDLQITLVEAVPITGRLHQIRASAAAIGHPVVGDKLYGSDPTIYDRFRCDKLTPLDRSHLRLERQALHAAELTFVPPDMAAPITLRTPLPSEMQILLDVSGRP
jgi:23S rRNA pseudouridine1911/1915/1917 synthase